jgi:hypothetical protein
MEENNLIVVHGVSYNDLKNALNHWIVIYINDLPNHLTFMLYKSSSNSHVIKVDDRLENGKFYFLINYLKYSKEINDNINIEGYTIGKDNNVLKNKKIQVYIPNDDKDFDNVSIATNNNKNFKVDFGGSISEIQDTKKYFFPETFQLDDPEIIETNKRSIENERNEKIKNGIKKRYNIIIQILILAFILNLFLAKITHSFNLINKTTEYLIMGTYIWFFIDDVMFRTSEYYLKGIFIGIGIFIYTYCIIFLAIKNIDNMTAIFSICPLIYLIIQRPIRKIYIFLFEEEPVIYYRDFSDIIYVIIILILPIVLPVIIGDWFK